MAAGAVERVLHHVDHHEHRLHGPEAVVEADEQHGGQHGHWEDEQRE